VLARQVAALDQLSGGRFVLGAGLGLDTSGGELSRFGEELDDRVRAEMLDEGLALLGDLLAGRRVDHPGPHFTALDVQFEPAAVAGRVPVWVAGRWPNRRPLQRAARHDGLFLIDVVAPADLSAAAEVIGDCRDDGLAGFDLVVQLTEGESPRPWEAAGATWWLACFDPFTVTATEVRQRIKRGPQG
jgi:alkanesulfonate monooxygenase SsuD/methylene tetrahydromethanopterin reductase-like flavin-dependent oxidoreductase (luciferase family)